MRKATLLTTAWMLLSTQLPAEELPVFDFDPHAQFRFEGSLGQRIDANRRNWLIRAPASNPGLLEMFKLRDRQPEPELVPWAGEFVGKYLISAVQALRMTDDVELQATVRAVVAELIASQAEDGYLGPFPKQKRLLQYWDLWGHYHCMLALMMWHEQTGNDAALQTCTRAADLVCNTYLDTDRRVYDAGSHEMNMAIIHALGILHRKTGNPRYVQMMRHIEEDWQRAGDYFRTGLAGVEFFRSPKPRWESIHDLQGLGELYRITGDRRYRTSLLNHWHSIRRWDRRNSGAFSSGEQADGNPYKPSAIETCCTIAWMAMTVDALRLTGNPMMADELELSTWNLVRAAQHPSGSWWTYNTPMDGAREASAHSIVFQSRPGTPELNCCSVNAPRGLGMLSEWAVMRSAHGLVVNYYGPMTARSRLADGTPVTLTQQTDYPVGGTIRLQVAPAESREFTVALRIPVWSRQSTVEAPGMSPVAVKPGTHFAIRRTWRPGDEIVLNLDMRLRYESGDLEMLGRMSIYRGPLLLAYDVRRNDFDEQDIPVLNPALLVDARITIPPRDVEKQRIGQFAPLLLVEIPAADGRTLRLCDFGTAGSTGSRYVSWLAAEQIVPPPPVSLEPRQGAAVGPGPMIFSWRRPPAVAAQVRTHTLLMAATPDFREPVLAIAGHRGHRLIVPAEEAGRLEPNTDYYWKLIATNPFGSTESIAPAKRFHVDPNRPALSPQDLAEFGEGPEGIVTAAKLRGTADPSYGNLAHVVGATPAEGRDGQPNGAMQLDGQSGMIVYGIKAFPTHQYTVSLWMAHQQPVNRFGQVFSAWCGGRDDPLRLCIDGGRLFARIESVGVYSSPGQAVEPGKWYHVAAVKDGEQLSLYLDGQPVASLSVPSEIFSRTKAFALGGNPKFTEASEFLRCRVADLKFYARALRAEEITEIHRQGSP